MAGSTSRKRVHQDYGAKSSNSMKQNKRQKQRQFEYHSDSDEEEEDSTNPDFKPVNLLDSDNEDLDNIAVDDVASASSGSDSDSAASSSSSSSDAAREKKPAKSAAAAAVVTAATRSKKRKAVTDEKVEAGDEGNEKNGASDEEGDENEEEDDADDDEEEEEDSDASDEDGASTATGGARRTGANKSKRNDPTAFATSLSKILSTKLSTGRRADPVLARSADAQQAAREVLDSALEAKARKQMREQRRLAQEKGRVRDVLGGGVSSGVSTAAADPEAQRKGGQGGVAYTQQSERRLRKVAHRGVVVLFRAVREAQERAAQAERDARRDGVYGVKTREEKVSEMSRQGFLDLIANGGGKMKQGALEEA